jgi:hypothetical protein
METTFPPSFSCFRSEHIHGLRARLAGTGPGASVPPLTRVTYSIAEYCDMTRHESSSGLASDRRWINTRREDRHQSPNSCVTTACNERVDNRLPKESRAEPQYLISLNAILLSSPPSLHCHCRTA